MYLQKLKIAIILYVIILSIVRAQSNIRKARTSEEIRKAASEETTEKNSEETTDKNSEEIGEEASEEIRKATSEETTEKNLCCVFTFTYNFKVLFHVPSRKVGLNYSESFHQISCYLFEGVSKFRNFSQKRGFQIQKSVLIVYRGIDH